MFSCARNTGLGGISVKTSQPLWAQKAGEHVLRPAQSSRPMPEADDDKNADQAEDAGGGNGAPSLGGPGAVAEHAALGSRTVRDSQGFRDPCQGGVEELGELVIVEGVAGQSGESGGVAEALKWRDGGTPDEDRGDDEEDALEDAGKGHDETRRPADLVKGWSVSGEWSSVGGGKTKGVLLTRQTLATLSRKATRALRSSVRGPAVHRWRMSKVGTSPTRATMKFMAAQTGA